MTPGGSDFLPVNQMLTFTSEEDRLCFNVTVLDDDFLELPENISLLLESEDPSVILAPEEAVIIIQDTDCKWKFNSTYLHSVHDFVFSL